MDMVMVVDTDRDALRTTVEALGQAGFFAVPASGGDAALRLLDDVTPHLVLLDAAMPGQDGFEICRRIKGQAQSAHLPVIFTTGPGAPDDMLRGFEAGGVDFVVKPVNMAELLARMRIHIAHGRMALAGAANPEETLLREKLGLTWREAEVLAWIARGKFNAEISQILSISTRTVDKHLERIFIKLGIGNRAAAVSRAMRALAAYR